MCVRIPLLVHARQPCVKQIRVLLSLCLTTGWNAAAYSKNVNDSTPRRTLLESPIARAAIAAVILAVLVGVTLFLRSRSGSSSSAPISTSGRSTQDATTEAGLGALDENRPIVGQQAPNFALRDTNGNVVKLSDLRGKVVWVNFWASWCVPCKKELPDIQKLYDEKHAAGLEVLALNLREDADTATGFFTSRALSVPLLLDSGGKVYDQYRLQGLPDSFFVDRDGKIAALQFGFLTEEKMRQRLKTAGLE